MYYMIIHLRDDSRLTEVMMALTEIDALSVQVLESTSAQKLFAFDVPIFAGFREMFGESSEQSKVICAIAEQEDAPEQFVEMMQIASIDFIKDNVGDIFLINIHKALISDQ